MPRRPSRPRQPARPAAAVLLAALAACGPAHDARAPDAARVDAPAGAAPRPSVLLVSLDTVRADRLGAYGHARPTSPHLDRLAEHGVLFEDCVATSNWTLPTHVSLFTGLSPLTHGVEEPTDRLPAAAPTLGEAFGRAGYVTAGFYSNPLVDPVFGHARGFERFERALPEPQHGLLLERAGEPKGAVSGTRYPEPGPRAEDYYAEQTAAFVTRRGLRFLEERRADERFFLFLHYNDAHADYIPPAPWDRAFDPDYAGTLSPARYTSNPRVHADMDPRDLAWIQALYDGELRWVDEQLGALLGALRTGGRLRDTLVVVTADHGEGFFERGFKEHHYGLYRELLHVPLILHWPAGLPAGLRVGRTVSQADVAPTLLELAGLPPLPHTDGRSLAPLLRGEPLERRPALSRSVLKPLLDRPGDELVAITTPDLRAVLRRRPDGGDQLEVFDRRVDPLERVPLPPGPRTAAARRALLQAVDELARRRPELPWVGADAEHPVDPELLEQLRQWGYIK